MKTREPGLFDDFFADNNNPCGEQSAADVPKEEATATDNAAEADAAPLSADAAVMTVDVAQVETPPQVETAADTAEESQMAAVDDNGQEAAEAESKNTPRAKVSLSLFATFFKIGLFTFGGGYAMIPMIEAEVVDKKRWLDKQQFLDLIAVAQTCPGVFAINISTFLGYKLCKNTGAVLAALGAGLPSFLIILLLAPVIHSVQDIPWVAACFRGIRPAVVALIAVPTFSLAKAAKINIMTCWIPILSALLIWAMGVNPVLVILAAGFGGFLYGHLIKQ